MSLSFKVLAASNLANSLVLASISFLSDAKWLDSDFSFSAIYSFAYFLSFCSSCCAALARLSSWSLYSDLTWSMASFISFWCCFSRASLSSSLLASARILAFSSFWSFCYWVCTWFLYSYRAFWTISFAIAFSSFCTCAILCSATLACSVTFSCISFLSVFSCYANLWSESVLSC